MGRLGTFLFAGHAEAQTPGVELCLELLRRYVFHLELVRVLDERLLQVSHDFLPDGFLHGQMPFQVLHVVLKRGRTLGLSAAAALVPFLLGPLGRQQVLFASRAHRYGAVGATRANAAQRVPVVALHVQSPQLVRQTVVVIDPAEYVPQVWYVSLARHFLPTNIDRIILYT